MLLVSYTHFTRYIMSFKSRFYATTALFLVALGMATPAAAAGSYLPGQPCATGAAADQTQIGQTQLDANQVNIIACLYTDRTKTAAVWKADTLPEPQPNNPAAPALVDLKQTKEYIGASNINAIFEKDIANNLGNDPVDAEFVRTNCEGPVWSGNVSGMGGSAASYAICVEHFCEGAFESWPTLSTANVVCDTPNPPGGACALGNNPALAAGCMYPYAP
jgi:hypothetical protein